MLHQWRDGWTVVGEATFDFWSTKEGANTKNRVGVLYKLIVDGSKWCYGNIPAEIMKILVASALAATSESFSFHDFSDYS